MTLFVAVQTYIDRKRAFGVIFEKAARDLGSFSKRAGDVPLETITPGQILAFLNGPRTSTVTWRVKFNLLKHFFEYWYARLAPGLTYAEKPCGCPTDLRALYLHAE